MIYSNNFVVLSLKLISVRKVVLPKISIKYGFYKRKIMVQNEFEENKLKFAFILKLYCCLKFMSPNIDT